MPKANQLASETLDSGSMISSTMLVEVLDLWHFKKYVQAECNA